MTETRVTPWYRDTAAFARQRSAQIRAAIEGRAAPSPSDPMSALFVGMMYDADLIRAALEIVSLLALPEDVMARPGMLARVKQVAGTHDPVFPPGPRREELVRILAQRRAQQRSAGGRLLRPRSIAVPA